jgi:Zn-dependent protease
MTHARRKTRNDRDRVPSIRINAISPGTARVVTVRQRSSARPAWVSVATALCVFGVAVYITFPKFGHLAEWGGAACAAIGALVAVISIKPRPKYIAEEAKHESPSQGESRPRVAAPAAALTYK